MAVGKFHGAVGYGEMKETAPGVFQEVITEKTYFGDLLRSDFRHSQGEQLNTNLVNAQRISIVADPYAYQKYYAIKYVKYSGAKWSVTKVEPSRPRIILTLGEVYNEQTPRTSHNIRVDTGG